MQVVMVWTVLPGCITYIFVLLLSVSLFTRLSAQISEMASTKKNFIQSGLSKSSNRSTSVRSRLNLMEKFNADGLIPDVIDAPPLKQLELAYGTKLVEPGAILTPTDVQNPPVVSLGDAESDAYYTLIMNDPDAPSRSDPKFGEWHHWLVVNIPGGNVSAGETVAEYVGAGPPPETGLHRYVFLLYKQAGKKDFGLEKLNNRSQKGRAKHSIRDFVTKSGLSELVAGNFFFAEYDDYVPKLYEQLSG